MRLITDQRYLSIGLISLLLVLFFAVCQHTVQSSSSSSWPSLEANGYFLFRLFRFSNSKGTIEERAVSFPLLLDRRRIALVFSPNEK